MPQEDFFEVITLPEEKFILVLDYNFAHGAMDKTNITALMI